MKNYIVHAVLLLVFSSCYAQDNKNSELQLCKETIATGNLEIGFVLADRFIVHGYIDSTYSPRLKDISFFRIMDCRSSKNIVEQLFCFERGEGGFCLPFTTKTKKTDSTLTIVHYGRLAYGENWELKD